MYIVYELMDTNLHHFIHSDQPLTYDHCQVWHPEQPLGVSYFPLIISLAENITVHQVLFLLIDELYMIIYIMIIYLRLEII